MEQEHGTDAAAICKGVLLRIGMAAAMSTAVLGFLSYHVLPRLRKTDYIKMVSDADAQTALTLAPLVLLAICCLCVYPLIGHGKRSRADVVAVACTVASFVLLGAGLVNMSVEKTMTPPLTVSIFLFCLMLAHRPGLPFTPMRSLGSRMVAAFAVPATSMPAAKVAAAATPAAIMWTTCRIVEPRVGLLFLPISSPLIRRTFCHQ